MSAGYALITQRLGDRGQLELLGHGRVVPSGHGSVVGDGAAGGMEGADDSGRLLVTHGGDRVGRLVGTEQAGG